MLLILMAIGGGRAGLQKAASQVEQAYFLIFSLFFESHNLEAISQERFGNTTSTNVEKWACFAPLSPGSTWPAARSPMQLTFFVLSSQAYAEPSLRPGYPCPRAPASTTHCSPLIPHPPAPAYVAGVTQSTTAIQLHFWERGKERGLEELFSSPAATTTKTHPAKHTVSSWVFPFQITHPSLINHWWSFSGFCRGFSPLKLKQHTRTAPTFLLACTSLPSAPTISPSPPLVNEIYYFSLPIPGAAMLTWHQVSLLFPPAGVICLQLPQGWARDIIGGLPLPCPCYHLKLPY